MATVRDILAVKGSQVDWIGPHATVYDAAERMNESRIGSLAVLDGNRLIGILTERDILRKVVALRRDPVETLVEDVMTSEVVCCRPHTRLEEASGVMTNRRVRHLPVVGEDGELLGMVSIGDLNAHQTHAQELTIKLLHEYIYGYA
ncbi:MAG: CBS domain-containing protein [Gemmataceae bacterium]